MASKIPPLLEPYLALPPEASLILLTNVLGASTNWLVLRFLHSTLATSSNSLEVHPEDETKVVFVSFLRDFAFWKDNARRLGLDLEKHAAKKSFAFVDGLSGLFLPKQQRPAVGPGETVLSSPSLTNVSEAILKAIQDVRGSSGAKGNVLLVVDQLDLLLAVAGNQVGAVNLEEMLAGLREEVHSAIITVSADHPLVSALQTPLETNHASFLVNIAHQADFIMGLRLLDSGTATDVSGVVRVTIGDQVAEDDDFRRKIDERELLYFVAGDGGVRVFERGQ
ncbi:Uncharacterized protein BP5553_09630 [Venustampulla echinocandica]|uniref:Elongator complex protein 6 n=1 Tax=Venustampulla echinocandica TaxID=2656787 RepID=A0A370TBI9_9HELO|nr:Uncharacterized protein BP5553_09630 [Venustampulla echinocandica]RDL31421.1 Uncharacterized protein BP5553_09630 [Venustampulla echinocandica]